MYEINVRESSKELTKADKARLINISGVEALDVIVPNDGSIIIEPVDYVAIDIHNDKAKGESKDYSNYLIYTADGKVYRTGSETFWTAFKSIWDIFNDGEKEPFNLNVFKAPSKNYSGKYFLTCALA